MTHDRHDSDNAKRTMSCGASPPRSEGGLRTRNEAPPLAKADACSSQEDLAILRENALLKREESIQQRENDLNRREKLLSVQQGISFALRVQEISDAQIAKATQDYRYSKLKEANEWLVIDSRLRAAELEKAGAPTGHFDNHEFL
jgi:hypothetical protein